MLKKLRTQPTEGMACQRSESSYSSCVSCCQACQYKHTTEHYNISGAINTDEEELPGSSGSGCSCDSGVPRPMHAKVDKPSTGVLLQRQHRCMATYRWSVVFLIKQCQTHTPRGGVGSTVCTLTPSGGCSSSPLITLDPTIALLFNQSLF